MTTFKIECHHLLSRFGRTAGWLGHLRPGRSAALLNWPSSSRSRMSHSLFQRARSGALGSDKRLRGRRDAGPLNAPVLPVALLLAVAPTLDSGAFAFALSGA